MATNGSKRRQASAAPPPRTLNVHKFAASRASELQSLHSVVANRLNDDFRTHRNKRRRTTGYDDRATKHRYRKKHKVGVMCVVKDGALENNNNNRAPRRIRRRIEFRKNPESGFCTSRDGTKRLRTHLWHAKRFRMTKIWGFHLPLGLQGRGRGSRAILKCLKDGALVHDASYCSAVQLEGPEHLLLSVLSTVLVPSRPAHSEDISHKVLSGVIYGSAMLHHVGAPFPNAIAPVIYMWRPFHRQHTQVDAEGHNTNGCDKLPNAESCSSIRQVWVWIHAAAFREGYDALTSTCERLMDKAGLSIKCISLEDQLAKLEVMGSRTVQLLRRILHPVTCSDNSWRLNKCSAIEADSKIQLKNSSILENDDHIPPRAIISLTVNDPRALTDKGNVFVKGLPTGLHNHIREDEVKEHITYAGIPERSTGLTSSLCLKPEENSDLPDCIDLWDTSEGICPPIDENVLCMEKHHQHMALFCLGDKSSEPLNAPIKGQCSRLCPILLLKDNNQEGSIIRWSIILPLNWVKAFWVPIVSRGAHAIGLREKHWITCEVGLPSFPSDFPDCSAYSIFMASEAAVSDQKAKLRPPSMRPLKVPIPPPWDNVRLAFDNKFIGAGDAQILPENTCHENMADDNSLPQSDCQNGKVIAPANHGVSFGGFVARTSYMLAYWLNNISGDLLLLFPNMADRKKCMSEPMKDEEMARPNASVSLTSYGEKLCFVRVLLHAYKEGVFEEGAVVCAPQVTDINLWTSRSVTDDEKLQIPQSMVGSYFIQSLSGKWELQITDATRESHRWPIGFVTTGFVRGSKKSVAVALCEAVFLARLKQEQWNVAPVKRRKEIYVLVRNMKSTAYRLALATVVLEQKEEDLEYM